PRSSMAAETKDSPPRLGTAKPDEEGVNLILLMAGVRKHWALVAALTILGAGIAFLYAKSQPRVYQASAMMEFDPNPVRPMGEKNDPMMSFMSYFDNQEN